MINDSLDSANNDIRTEAAYGDVWFWWRNALYLFREQFWVGVIAAILVICLDITLYVYAVRVYTSDATFIVDQSPFQFGITQNDVEGSRLLIQSIISSITSNDMRDIIARRLDVEPKQVCILGLSDQPLSLRRPNEVNIAVTTERSSRVATIEATSCDPDYSSRAANALLDEILSLNELVGLINNLDGQIKAQQIKVDKYGDSLGTAMANRIQLEQSVLGINRHKEAGGNLESAPAFANDPVLLELQKKQIEAEASYRAQAQVSIRGQQLESLDGARHSVDRQIQSYLENREIGLRSGYAEAEADVTSLEAQIKTEGAVLDDLLGQKANLLKAVGDFHLRRKLGLFNGNNAKAEAGVIVILDRARPAHFTSKPKSLLYAVAGLFGALVLCPGCMLLRHHMDRRIKFPHQIEWSGNVPCLAVLPEAAETSGDINTSQPYIPGRESVAGLSYLRNQLLRGNLLGNDNRIVSFMDLGTAHSSSQWVAQLGWLLARAEKPTLLVDLDFNNPRLAQFLDIPTRPGLAEWGKGNEPLDQYIAKSHIAQIGLLQPGNLGAEGDMYLSRRALAGHLKDLQEKWPYILIYAPSLLENHHLLLAAPLATPVVALVHYSMATLHDMEEAVVRCESCHFRFAGVILYNYPLHRIRGGSTFELGPHRYILGNKKKEEKSTSKQNRPAKL